MSNPNDVYAVEFLDILESMGLMQHVDVPLTSKVILSIRSLYPPTIRPFFSDHAAVFCSLISAKPHASARLTTYRKLKSIDLDALKCDIVNSALCTDKMTDLNELAGCYNSTLSSLIDRYAPLHSKRVINRQRIPWFNGEIISVIRVRRIADKNRRHYHHQRNLMQEL